MDWSSYNDQKGLTLQTLEGPFGEIKEKFCEQFPQFQKHVQIKQIMHDNFEQDKKDSKCHLLQVDFAMAYSCAYQNEVQSALWSCQTVNLFTAATYDTNGKEKSFLIVTDSQDKSKNNVFTFILQLLDEIKFQPGEELIVYSDGPSSEFKNKFITGRLLFLLSDKLKRNVWWKYFATSHGKGVVDGIGGAAKARVHEQIRSRGPGAVVVQNLFDFANVSAKLLKNVKVIHISKDEIESAISTMKPWDFVLEAKGVTSCHVAKCSDSIVKMWHAALDTDEEAAVILSYDPVPPVFEGSLPTETKIFSSLRNPNLRMERANNYWWLGAGPLW